MLSGLKIGVRLSLLVLMLSVVLLAVGLIGLTGMSATKERLRSVYEDRTLALRNLTAVTEYTYRMRGAIDAALYEQNAAEVAHALDKIGPYNEKREQAWQKFLATNAAAEDKALVDQVDSAIKTLNDARAKGVDALRSQSRERAYEVLKSVEYRNKLYAFRDLFDKLIDLQVKQADAEYQASIQEFARAL